MAKGSLWSNEEIKCLLEIWSDENIQIQLDNTHKNTEIFRIIRNYLHARGYNRTIEQCRDKLKKMRLQYRKVRDAVDKSGSSPDEKDKFPWYDAIDSIIGKKPKSEPNVIESHSITPPPTTPYTSYIPSDHEKLEPLSPPVSLPVSGTSDETHTETSNYCPRSADNRRKRKAKNTVSSMMSAFMDMQKKQYDEFLQSEQLRQQQQKDILHAWMKSQTELEERRLQAQREERQETNKMFMQMMSRLFDVIVPSSQQHTPSHLQHPPLSRHYYQASLKTAEAASQAKPKTAEAASQTQLDAEDAACQA